MIYKLYLIEIVGSFPILFGVFSALTIIILLCLIAKYDQDIDNFYGYGNDERDAEIKRKFKKRIYILLCSLITCLSISILTPNKVFMYSVTGINETIKFLEGNEEVKKISEKTIKIINNKLDALIDEE